MSRIRKTILSCVGLAAASLSSVAQSEPVLAPQLQGGEPSSVPVTVQNLRWAMLNPDVNSLTFRSMDQLFTTRTVAHAGPASPLPRADAPLNFTYSFSGQSYSAEQGIERTHTNAILVMKDGRIVYEAYRNNSNSSSRFMGWSTTKSLVSLMVGIALDQGLIKSIDDPVDRYLPELAEGGYKGVTIRQILQMRSGVDYEERYDFNNPGIAASNHINALVKNNRRFVEPARTIKRKHTPGSRFEYKTIDTAVLGLLIERVSGTTLSAFMTRNLWEPIGAEADGFFIMDGLPGAGREFSGAGFSSTLRDYARIGQMMLDGGKINGKQVVPASWVALSTRPTANVADPVPGYGMQWWMMGDSAYSAIGLQGQYIFVDPATRTVIVKFSYFPPADETVSSETDAFLRAASAWQPR